MADAGAEGGVGAGLDVGLGAAGDDPAAGYVALALRLDRVLPGVLEAHLDSHPGGRALAARIADEPRPSPSALVREVDRLRAAVPGAGFGPQRRAVLDAQLRACRVLAEQADGRSIGFAEEVARTYGVRIHPGDPDRYRETHRALDGLLGGRGPLRERLASFRDRDRLPADRLPVALDAAAAALRARTAAVLGLPAGEAVDVEVVEDAPWSGFSRRTGPLRSSVAVNRSAGHRVTHLPLLVAHEAYPGHHTEHCRAEARSRAGGSPPERSVFLARTPQSLFAEAAAELGLDVVVGPGWGRWNAEVLAAAGLATDPGRAERGEAIERVMADLAPVRQDAALMLHAEGRGADEVVAHLRRWLLVDEARARRMLRFLAHPRWRTHTTTYVEGVRRVRPWLWSDPAPEAVTARFARLLDDPPSLDALAAAGTVDGPRSGPVRWAHRLRRTVLRGRFATTAE